MGEGGEMVESWEGKRRREKNGKGGVKKKRGRERKRGGERQCKVEGELGGKEGINGGRKREQRKMEKEGGRIEEESKK